MKKKLTNNLGLKICSFVFAVLLWLVVVNVDNPVKTKQFDNIPVKLQNVNLITEEGLVYEILDSTGSVSVSVSAPRSYLELLSREDIVAVADFENITAANTINITYYSKRYNDRITNFKGNIESVKLNIEPKKMLQLVLKTKTTGSVEEGYVVGKVTTDQNQVRISGPQSVVEKIKSAVISVDISGTTTDIATYADVRLYDAEENEISAESIVMNVSSVKVGVEILATRTVPIQYSVMGTPAAGFRQTGEISAEPSEITIAGSADVLKNITQLDVPSEALNINGKKENLVAGINLKNYLPEGISIADDNYSGKAVVTVYVEQEQEKELKLNKSNIVVTNVPEGYNISVDEEEEIVLKLTGLQADISEMLISDVVGKIDMAAYMETAGMSRLQTGEYEAEAVFDFNENITIMEPVKVKLIVQKAEEE